MERVKKDDQEVSPALRCNEVWVSLPPGLTSLPRAGAAPLNTKNNPALPAHLPPGTLKHWKGAVQGREKKGDATGPVEGPESEERKQDLKPPGTVLNKSMGGPLGNHERTPMQMSMLGPSPLWLTLTSLRFTGDRSFCPSSNPRIWPGIKSVVLQLDSSKLLPES